MNSTIPQALELAPSELNPGAEYQQQKRAFDLVLIALALPVLLPVCALCALAIKLTSPGPIVFRQVRTGVGGRPFQMYKFRSMVVDAEARKSDLRREVAPDGVEGPDFKLKNDPRITWVGAILRKTSLDELPQLWNVVRGDMSLVGPRPTSFSASTYELWHTERLEARPGMTGLWQVTKRGDIDFNARVRLDVEYLRNRSLRLDLWILLKTVPAVFYRRGAF